MPMPHHNKVLPAEEDRRIALFLAQAYADSRSDPKPETALRRALGYWVQSMNELLRYAYTPDELAVSCHVCADDLDIGYHTHWATVQHAEGEICGPCVNRLEDALPNGSIINQIPDQQNPLLPDTSQPTGGEQARRMRYSYTQAMHWLDLLETDETTRNPD